MANSKTNSTKTSKKSDEKVEKAEKIEVVENKSEEVEELKKQLEEMKKAMAELISVQKQEAVAAPIVVKQEESEVVIGCRVLQGIGWEDPVPGGAGEVRLGFNEEQAIPVSDMKRFFRQRIVRQLFEDGLCYFAEPEDYALFNIRKYADLSNENLVGILTQENTNDIIRELDKLTNSKKNSGIVNCLVFRICDMIRKNELQWDYYIRKSIEQYFGVEFDRGIVTLNALEAFKG